MEIGQVVGATSTSSGKIIWTNPAVTPARLHRTVKISLGENGDKFQWVVTSAQEILAVFSTQIHQMVHAGKVLLITTIGDFDPVDLDLLVGLSGGTFDPVELMEV